MRAEGVIGWDIGGAHLKAALVDEAGHVQRVVQLPCPLWRGINQLEHALVTATEQLGVDVPLHAVTMTGELADVFANRRAGVTLILDAFRARFPARKVKVFAGASGFVSPAEAISHTGEIASANWMASSLWLASCLAQGLLVDIGSTTADLGPFARGKVCVHGYSDLDRLQYEELVYSGVVRTPLLSLARTAPFRGERVGVMAELFATTADVYRLLGRSPEDDDQYPAADGRGKSVAESAARLARMLGADRADGQTREWNLVAGFFAEQQLQQLTDACFRVISGAPLERSAPLIGAGVGRFLVVELARRLERPYTDFSDTLTASVPGVSHEAADCAPAVAVALLAGHGLPDAVV